ncbi:recombinase family protein [Dysosmobacter welbionis]|uniref:recombinase family protein n=1 Tax=Dysosmobacter welbionis TaxID=2093857 RepID=UPI003978C894
MTGKQVKNDGQLDMYLVEDAHEAIIDRETFDRVQKMKGQMKHKGQIEQIL